MFEKPIIFSGPMVRAILDDRKTQTRRVIKPQPTGPGFNMLTPAGDFITVWPGDDGLDRFAKCPYGKPGDRLWVRETLWISECGNYYARPFNGGYSTDYDILSKDGSKVWLANRYQPKGFDDTDKRYTHPEFPHMTSSWHNLGKTLRSGRYIQAFSMGFADLDTSVKIKPLTGNTVTQHYEATFKKKVPSIFMPRWASRITLEITSIRVERLKQISLENVEAEGTPVSPMSYRGEHARFEDFKILWDSINGKKYPYETSPWVWVIEFEKVNQDPTIAV